ncbi:uncharacterized protein LOC123880518 [Maniola jurtina]|uniref:uncharacterized protein LOC123880518 n=1 Tax=Maniola jurtina TaxID=191418 RepID=UPI001E686455|nr:uncharacterized protein LOC123880518 [Maniola jurtina]
MSNVNPTYETSYKVKSKMAPQKESASNNRIEESDIGSEEILPPSTSRGNLTNSNTLQEKRALETENPESITKKLTASSVKQNKSASTERMKLITINTKKDFNFKKRLLPVRKGTLMRDNEPEILIAKSPQPLVGNVEPLSNLLKEIPQIVIAEDKSNTNNTKQPPPTNDNTVADTMYNSTNVSIKPSFRKRKLFTQTLDIVENNVSDDSSGVNSPQTKTLRTCREKNKVRKFTSQSCLSRDVTENNFMDMLRRFLPPDQKKNQTLSNTNHSFMPHHKQQNVTYDNRYPEVPETCKDQCSESQSASVVTLKDRLAKDASLLLPIQMFNMSNVNPTYETSYKVKSKMAPQKESASNNRIEESDIGSEEILPPSTSRGNLTNSNTLQEKRALETENPESITKKLTASSVKQNKSASTERMKLITINTKKDFNFKKRLLPVRKGTLMRDNEPEILIAKSPQPLVGNAEPLSNLLKEIPQIVITEDKSDTNNTKQPPPTNDNTVADTMYNSTNVSIKPSFRKRKLFTQTLDIVENNVSDDSSGVNSPQTKTLRTCREKNKVRKFTSQSCLSRDVTENNFMDMLRRFLPPDQKKNQTLSNTNVTNKKEASKCSQMKDKKCDVNLAIALTDMHDGSETFTDEEIFNALEKDKTKQHNKDTNKGPDLADVPKQNQKAPASICKATLQKTKETPNVIGDYTELNEKQYPKKRTVKSLVKSFWESEFESDKEDVVTQTSQNKLEEDLIPSGSQFLMNGTNKIDAKKKPTDTTLPVRNPSKLGKTQRIQSDDTQKLKRKMLENNQHENKENIHGNKLNKRTCSPSKSNKANIQTEKTTNNKSDTNKVSNKANNHKNQQKPKPRTASSKRNNTPSQGQASLKKSSSTNDFKLPEVESHSQSSRESRARMRRKQKREASLSNSSTDNTTSPIDQSHKNNTSRASKRLKQKRIAKLNNSFTNHIMSSENESDKCTVSNTCIESMRSKRKRKAKLNGNPMKSKKID